MANDVKEIRIRPIGGPSKTWLRLEGTILSIRQLYWSGETIVDIPLELVQVDERRQFRGTLLIAALLSLALPLIAMAVAAILWEPVGTIQEGVATTVTIILMLGAIAAFIVFLVRFCRRQRSIVISFAPRGSIAFWVDRKREGEVRAFLDTMHARMVHVEDHIPYALKSAFGDTIQRPWKRTVGLVWLFLIPGLILEKPLLLLLGLIPIAGFLYQTLWGMTAPGPYRRAVRHYLARRWADAKNCAEQCIQMHPEFLPARLFLVELLTRLDDFPGAEYALAQIQDDLNVDFLRQLQNDLIFMQRIARRKKDDF